MTSPGGAIAVRFCEGSVSELLTVSVRVINSSITPPPGQPRTAPLAIARVRNVRGTINKHTRPAPTTLRKHLITMAARALAASRNVCTTLIKYFDLEQYTKASPEMKSAIQALENVRAGGCKCGNARPSSASWAAASTSHARSAISDFAKVANRKGLCNFPGCNCEVLWPCRPCEAFDDVQEAAKDAFQKLDHALQIEEHKDVNEGARRAAPPRPSWPRGARRGRGHVRPGRRRAVLQMFARVAQELAPPPAPTRKRKVKRDYSPEAWEELKRHRKRQAKQRLENAMRLAEYDDLVLEVQRLKGLLHANHIVYSRCAGVRS